MLSFLTLKPEAFGLDISDLSLKIIKLKKKGKFFDLASFGETEIKPGIIKKGEIRDEEKLVEIIKEAIKKVKGEKLKTKYVVASLPEEKAFLQIIQMPRMSDEDLKSAVIYEAENYIPLPIEQVYLDFQVVSSNHLDHFDVLIVALPRKIIDLYLSSLKKAGLQPLAFEIESQAIVRALIKDEVTTSPILLIDLGTTRTNFIIFSGCSIRFTTSFPFSSQKFTEAVSKNLGVDLKEAERLKLKYGLEEFEKIILKEKSDNSKFEKEIIKDKRILEALIPRLADLSEQIKKYLNYYQDYISYEHLSFNNKRVEKIFLSGSEASLKGLTNFLSLELKIPVEVANPWINILSKPSEGTLNLPFEKSLCYTTALGLALRGIKKEE